MNPQYLRLYAEGREVPLLLESSNAGEVRTWEGIEFYGTGLDTVSTDTRVYWLVAGSTPGERVKLSERTVGSLGSPSFASTVERKDRVFYFGALLNGDESNFFGPLIQQVPLDQILELRNLDAAAPGDGVLELRVQRASNVAHLISVLVNDVEVGT